MLTIAPRSPSSNGSVWLIAVAAIRIASNVPTKLMAITFLNASMFAAESYEPSLPMVRCAQPIPAEFTKTRSGPMDFAISTALMMSSVLVTSTAQNAPPTSFASASPTSCWRSRSAMTTFAPPFARRRTEAAPIPDAPPVTIALTPLSSIPTGYAIRSPTS
ncbi:unannotated protein [freshwater metagenome]|uniref:Unannotated protein n=1 Tax=freshwater metagenome TaxID=449393 RepID=A0A6J6AH90_9ZZZZ